MTAPSLTLTALPPEALIDLLTRAGSKHAGADQIKTDLVAGAPVNPDGTLNLVAYVAWLVRTQARKEQRRD